MNDMLLGAIAMASFIAGLFFLRFWKSSGDRFFLFFAIAFWIEAIVRVWMALEHPLLESFPLFYLMRLIAFGLIIFAILDKNRSNKRKT